MTPQEALASIEAADEQTPGSRQPMVINLGPQHPSTHGVLRLVTELDGEVIRDLHPVIGYLHTGIEKQCENKTYWQAITLVTRMDYLASYFNIHAYTIGGGEAPRPRGAGPCAVPARDHERAQPHHEPPGLARHQRPRARRDHGDLLHLPRAREGPRPGRDDRRRAHEHPLLPGGRLRRRHAPRLRARACASSSTRCPARIDEYEGLLVGQPDLDRPHPRRRACCRPSSCSTSA